MAGLGVRVLFGFLLSLPFSNPFRQLSGAQEDLYLVALLLAASSTAPLITPVAYHRLVFRRNAKGRVVDAANRMAIVGLATAGFAISCAVALIVSFVGTSTVAE